MLPDRLEPRIVAQKDQAVRAFRDGFIEQGDGALRVADAQIRGGSTFSFCPA
jgi:hypothetical protein